MTPLTAEAFRLLCTAQGGTCVSLYMPTRPEPNAAEENRIHFKNLLKQAEHELVTRLPKARVEALLRPLHALPAADFWQHPHRALAAFASESLERHFLLSAPTEERVVVADSFHVRPLLPQLDSNRSYFLLSLSLKQARLYRGTGEGLVPVVVPRLAQAVAAASGAFEHERAHGSRSTGPAGKGVQVQYAAEPTDEARLGYFRSVNQALWEVLHDERAPLVLAAPNEHSAAWRQACRYPHLLDHVLHGNHDTTSLASLHEKAWPLVREHAQIRVDQLIEKFGGQAAHGRGSFELSTIARAAIEGRVRELLLAEGRRLAGVLDRATGEVRVGELPGQGKDVYNDIAEAVVLRGGDVLTLPIEKMPQKEPIAAILRW